MDTASPMLGKSMHKMAYTNQYIKNNIPPPPPPSTTLTYFSLSHVSWKSYSAEIVKLFYTLSAQPGKLNYLHTA